MSDVFYIFCEPEIIYSLHMNAETVQKLKDKGFPIKKATLADDEAGLPIVELSDGKFYLLPTLDELIEECGSMVILYVNKDDCRAESINPIDFSGNKLSRIFKKIFTGSTTKEAMSNLYLELNK